MKALNLEQALDEIARLSARVVQLSIECDRLEDERNDYQRAFHDLRRKQENAR